MNNTEWTFAKFSRKYQLAVEIQGFDQNIRMRMNNFYKNRTKQFARGRTDTVTGMNNLEKRYADHLRTIRLAGEIHSFAFERHNLKLADRTYYKPDFEVMLPDGSIEFHEVKGFMMDDANVKIKVAAAQFPQYVFRLVQWDRKTGWKIKPYPPHNK